MLEVVVSAEKREPCADECPLRGEVVGGGVGEDGCHAEVGGDDEQGRQGFAGAALSPSGRRQTVADLYTRRGVAL